MSETKEIDRAALSRRNKFNISPSRAFAIGRLEKSTFKRRHQSVVPDASTQNTATKLESIKEEFMDTRTA